MLLDLQKLLPVNGYILKLYSKLFHFLEQVLLLRLKRLALHGSDENYVVG